MDARRSVGRMRSLTAAIALAAAWSIGSVGLAAAANPHQVFDVTACATNGGKTLIVTASWSGMTVDAWSWFVETTNGSGGVFEPVPVPGESGTATTTVGGGAASVLTVNASVFRATGGGNYRELASATLTQPASGWPRC